MPITATEGVDHDARSSTSMHTTSTATSTNSMNSNGSNSHRRCQAIVTATTTTAATPSPTSTSTNVATPSTAVILERQEEIDALRERVDSVLQKLLVGTELQHQNWQEQLNQFRQANINNNNTLLQLSNDTERSDAIVTTTPTLGVSNRSYHSENSEVSNAIVTATRSPSTLDSNDADAVSTAVVTSPTGPSITGVCPRSLTATDSNYTTSELIAHLGQDNNDLDDWMQLEELALVMDGEKPLIDASQRNDDDDDGSDDDVDDDATTGKWSVMTFSTTTPCPSDVSSHKKGGRNREDGASTPPTSVTTATGPRSLSSSSLTVVSSAKKGGILLTTKHVDQVQMVDPYGDIGVFTGSLRNDKPHGFGTMKYDDGRFYEGDWKYGRWHGRGKAQFANSDVYQGQYLYDQRHGYGHYIWKDGRTYIGQFEQDQRQGRGLYRWPNGSWYRGEFVKGQRFGQGEYQFAMAVHIPDNGKQGNITVKESVDGLMGVSIEGNGRKVERMVTGWKYEPTAL